MAESRPVTQFLGTQLWPELQRRMQGSGPKVVAVPYCTDDTRIRFGQGDTLIVNATEDAISGGQTDARLLLSAFRRGASVFCHHELHAKIVATEHFAVVSSANISKSSLSLREAGVLLSDLRLIAAVLAYVEELKEESTRLTETQLEQLAALPVHRSRTTKTGKPSLLEALQDDLPAFYDIAFGYYYGESELPTAEVKAAAQRSRIPLRSGWTHYEAVAETGVLETIRNACRDRPCVDFPTLVDSTERIVQFNPHPTKARKFLDVVKVHNSVVSYYDRPGFRCPVDLSIHRTRLATILNRALGHAPDDLVRRLSNSAGVLAHDDLRELFLLGSLR